MGVGASFSLSYQLSIITRPLLLSAKLCLLNS